MRRSIAAVLALLVASPLVGCGAGGSSDAVAPSEATGPRSPVCPEPFDGELTVAAAASLTEAFVEIGEGFEAACGGTVAFTFDSSGRLAQQVADGAPIDVFASADAISLERVEDEDLVEGTSAVFARNRLVAITRPGNPQGIEALADLADADLGVIALCAEQAACGRLAAQAVERAGVVLDEGSVTRGQNATATATAVARGDAVAGLVFSTDARAAGDAVAVVELPEVADVIAAYPIAVLRTARDRAAAEAFSAYVRSDRGRAILAEHGFLAPS